MPVHTYTNWNSRPSDREEQVEPYRKYYFICEGANTETFYFENLSWRCVSRMACKSWSNSRNP